MKHSLILFLSAYIFSGCSVVGFGTGTLIDTANRKRSDRIISNNQKINLEFVDGKIINAKYQGLAFKTAHYPSKTDTKNLGEAVYQEEL